MRQPISNEKIGQKFSPAFSNLRCTGNFTRMQVYQDYHSDIMTIWECEETGNKFAFFVNSGIRQISERLYTEQLNYFFNHGNVI